MGFGAIQFGGLASGLDTNAIINALLQLERRPLQALEEEKEGEEQKLSLIGTFETLVRDLQTKAQELAAGNTLYAYDLTVGTEGVASFTTSGGATPGAHELTVNSLARADRWTWDGIADPDTALGSGTITFDYNQVDVDGNLVPTSYTVNITAGVNDTLQGVADSINAEAGDDVTATVVNVGTESTPSYQLVLSGDDTGTDFAIQNLAVGGLGLTGQVNVAPASNAEVLIDGITVQRSTNVFADVLPGVSFTVTQGPDSFGNPATTTFTIDTDLEGVQENVQGFVAAYNEVIDFINQQNEFDVDEGTTGGDLFGDTSLQSIRGALTRALFGSDRDGIVQGTLPASEFQIGFETLGFVGIDLQSDGRLEIDETELSEKLAEDLDAFIQLFSNDFTPADPAAPTADAEDFQGDGLLLRLDRAIEDLLADTSVPDPSDPASTLGIDGLFNNRRNAINASIRSIDDQIERLEFHIEQREITLVQQFSRLEELIGQLNAQQAFLANNLTPPS